MMMRHLAAWRWWISALGMILISVGVTWFWLRDRATPDAPKYVCWDSPPPGSSVKYVVSFDEGTSVETKQECVRIPAGLRRGQHVASVRAVNTAGESSNSVSVQFWMP